MVKDNDLDSDPLLFTAPKLEGFKVLEPAVLYAKVGQGGMGAVYRGRHFSLECDVAVKVLKPDLARDEQFVLRFEREARLAARIKNENVVQVLDVKKKNGIHYLVMEFVRGETARERVARKGALAEQEALAIVLGAARGMRAAHQEGIVHRDLKPDNVLIGSDGAVKVSDLGLAKQKRVSEEQSMTMLSSGVMGTPQYMPPEQWKSPDVKPSADVWALGATLWYLLAGKSAIANGELLDVAERIRGQEFPELGDMRPEVRPEVRALIKKCTRRDPAERFADARDLLAALKPLCGADDEVAADAATGTGKRTAATVTPPPRSTLAKIKLQVENLQTPATIPAPEQLTVPTMASPTVAQAPETQPGTGVLTNRPHPRRVWLVLVTVTVLATATIGYGVTTGWFAGAPSSDLGAHPVAANKSADPSPSVVSAEDAAKVREALLRGEKALRIKGGVDDAIKAFREALGLGTDLVAARRGLVDALALKAQELAENNLDGAWDQIAEARERLPGDAAYRDVEKSVTTALRQRTLKTLRLDLPAPQAVLGRSEVQVKGSISAQDVQAVRLALVPLADAGAPFPAAIESAKLRLGEFDERVTAKGDGAFVVRVQIEDTRGLLAEIEPLGIVVDTTKPRVVITAPKAGEFVGGKVSVTGTVEDATTCTVAVATTDGQVDGDRWSAEVSLPDGEHRVLVVAKDAAGNEGSASAVVRVDSVAPRTNFAFDLAKVTKEPQFVIRGVAVDQGGGVVTLKADGEPVVLSVDGGFAHTKRFTDEREYEVVFVARDEAQNESTERLHVRYDATAPVLEWKAPEADVVPAGEIGVSGVVSEVSVVRLNETTLTTTGPWSAKVRIAAGSSVQVRVTARDEAGNEAKPLTRILRGEEVVVKPNWAETTSDSKLVSIDGKKYPSIVTEKQTGMRMVLIAPGEFMMGSPTTEPERDVNETQHHRKIRSGFYMAATEVRRVTWKQVMGGNAPFSVQPSELEEPLGNVSWQDCQEFLDIMNARGGRFRLPSEAEWEYACRAGTTTPFSFGDTVSVQQVNYAADHPYPGGRKAIPRGAPVPVGSLPANQFGLHEMHGNMIEWCEDVYGAYPGTGTEEPVRGTGPRVVRGGGYSFFAAGCRSAFRAGLDPAHRDPKLGFRFVVGLEAE